MKTNAERLGTAITIHERSDDERTRVAAFIRRHPEYSNLPHEVVLQYAETTAGVPDEEEALVTEALYGADLNFENDDPVTSDER